jgi:hypothetical protein
MKVITEVLAGTDLNCTHEASSKLLAVCTIVRMKHCFSFHYFPGSVCTGCWFFSFLLLFLLPLPPYHIVTFFLGGGVCHLSPSRWDLPYTPIEASDVFYNATSWSWLSALIQGVSKRALQLWKRTEIYTGDIHNILNCQNVAKHTEFYLG